MRPCFKKEDGRLDFTQPAIVLERRVRAYNPWPGTWFEWKGALLKVLRASVRQGEKPRRGMQTHRRGISRHRYGRGDSPPGRSSTGR